jgi:hypothetical protein
MVRFIQFCMVTLTAVRRRWSRASSVEVEMLSQDFRSVSMQRSAGEADMGYSAAM